MESLHQEVQLPNDMENYTRYQVMGSVSQVRMKPGCIPTRFECQPDRRKRIISTERPYAIKKQRRLLIEESEKDVMTKTTHLKQLEDAGPSGESSAKTPTIYERNRAQKRKGAPEFCIPYGQCKKLMTEIIDPNESDASSSGSSVISSPKYVTSGEPEDDPLILTQDDRSIVKEEVSEQDLEIGAEQELPETSFEVSKKAAVDVMIKEEPIDIHIETVGALRGTDACVKKETVHQECDVNVMPDSSLQVSVTVKQESVDEDEGERGADGYPGENNNSGNGEHCYSRTHDTGPAKTRYKNRRVSGRQLEMLWEFLNTHKDIACAFNRSLEAKEYASKTWKEVAELLNSERHGANKDWRGWSKYWVDYKAKLKKRSSVLRSQSWDEGSTEPPLSEIESKFLQVVGEDFGQGPASRVEPFPEPSASSSSAQYSPRPDDIQDTPSSPYVPSYPRSPPTHPQSPPPHPRSPPNHPQSPTRRRRPVSLQATRRALVQSARIRAEAAQRSYRALDMVARGLTGICQKLARMNRTLQRIERY
ncbi:uncharacterized protein [Epargyreus clarus]|uniref:uncharacterized protein isoform X2 n=1 Tax=Epargyreus clarus TaxID=520877 RepID=UPI003C2B7DD3